MAITNSGLAFAAAALLSAAPHFIGIGIGTSAAAAGDTSLASEIGLDGNAGSARGSGGSAAVSTVTHDGDAVIVTQAFTSVALFPFTITEVGLFDADGALLARSLIAPRTLVPGGVLQCRITWQVA